MSRRSAAQVRWSVPGARPSPRSMRPGCSSASVPNCSAITSGEWLGSMTPPAPSRMVDGVRRDVRDEHARRARGDRRHVVVLGVPDAREAEPLGGLRELDGAGEARASRLAWGDRGEVQHRETHPPSLSRADAGRRSIRSQRSSDASSTTAEPWPPPPQMPLAPTEPRPSCCSRRARWPTMRAPEAPIGWPSAIAPPLRVHDLGVDAELARRGDADGGERLVDLDGLQVARRRAGALERLLDRVGRLRVQRDVGAGDEAGGERSWRGR